MCESEDLSDSEKLWEGHRFFAEVDESKYEEDHPGLAALIDRTREMAEDCAIEIGRIEDDVHRPPRRRAE